ncbi:MAG: succinate dehydrogenase iron-sulfur subunit [Thermomicrobiales bacterium]|nr:succinate dehydrogenase iron-sulfur subunit [Thermomicrobiales bacterium]
MEVTFRIKRFNPEIDTKAAYKEYVVDVEPTDRVLDALFRIKWYQDGSLTFRRSCAHGICGSDAMRINGRNRLACKELMLDYGNKITIEPLLGYQVVKDLVIDMTRFFDAYKSVSPFLIADEAPVNRERLQSPADRDRFEDTTKCILCAACTTACPITWTTDQFVGPAAIVNAHRFIFDSRDQGAGIRLKVLNERSGVWRCRTVFNCTEACPRDIEITKAIEEVKRALLFDKVS